jgi:acetyl esterase/lipase
MKKIISLFLSMIVLFSISHVRAEEKGIRYLIEVFPEVTTQKNVIFGQVKDRAGKMLDLTMDIYQPKNDTLSKRPLVVWIHGGGFVSGSKENMISRCEGFAKLGYVSVTINYRLSRTLTGVIETAVSDAVSDSQLAIDFLRTHALEYGIDVDQIFVGGSSAGGITSLHLAYENKGWNKQGILGVIDLWGALFDLSCVDPTDPPVIIIHGEQDNVVPFALSPALIEKLKTNKIPYQFFPVKDVGHGVKPSGQLPYHFVEAMFMFQYLKN